MLTKKNVLAVTVGAICAAVSGSGFAAALDRSGQSISAFLRPGNYAEYGGSFLNPVVDGKDKSGNSTGDVANSYNFIGGAIKVQPFKKVSFGLIYDEPFGASVEYHGDNDFVATPTDAVLAGLPLVTGPSTAANGSFAYGLNAGITGDTDVEVRTRNISALVGFQPIEGLNIYGGGVYQEIKGEVQLRGSTYSAFNGYNASIPTAREWGWLAGVAYEIPEIALKVSLTYRSEIDYNVRANEQLPLADALGAQSAQLGGLVQLLVQAGGIPATTGEAIKGTLNSLGNGLPGGKTKITTPQSVNLDFQTGIMANTVAFGNVRWVQWSKFAIRPAKFGQLSEALGPLIGRPDGFNLVDYSKDQWSANLGLGRKFSDQIGGTVSVGWDSGAGNPVTTLGPTDGYWNVGVGLRYSPTPKVEISAGIKYFWLGDAKAQTGAYTYAGDFKNNSAMAGGVKLGLNF